MLNYGIIGNCKTCALVSKRGSIDWFCFPKFDSPSVFAKILDKERGGSLSIHPKGRYKVTQQYLKDTNILETTFTAKKASFVVLDFFPRYRKLLPNRKQKLFRQNRLIRIVKPLKGNPLMRVQYDPRLNYAKGVEEYNLRNGNLLTKNKKHHISLISNVAYDAILNHEYFELNHTKYFVIGKQSRAKDFSATHCLRLLNWTKQYWKKWVSTLVLPERHRELIIRSALVLKLLTFSETGAIIAAPTTSIPEEIGSERTWDYRYCWIRDAVFTIDALKKIGREYEAKKLVEFIFDCTKQKRDLQIMYSIEGKRKLTERRLEHLEGFQGCKPVRIGNAAWRQKQNDIYGSLINVLYLYYVYYEYEKKMPKKYWRFLRYLVKRIKNHWREPDHGIWEFRERKEHFTYSKLMCYVGMNLAVKLAQFYDRADLAERWIGLRDKIYEDISEHGWNRKRRAFAMHYGSDALDAAVLMMDYHDFLDPKDPRLISTIKKIYKELRRNSFVQRYTIEDDFGKSKSAFLLCSFWLIDALYSMGEVEKANKMFQKLLKYANHLGLFSEDIDLKTKKLLGNFPQAYTHVALINTSILLSEWNAKRKKIDWGQVPRKKWF